ncbi:hypothetical protein HW49_04890 [Porphyromonadaceae bacterium COT-184 OH4590]|nr:hypothetical protein HW49_04890 [Porphyromonadaceae bacterium COT-184 OH4590]
MKTKFKIIEEGMISQGEMKVSKGGNPTLCGINQGTFWGTCFPNYMPICPSFLNPCPKHNIGLG